MPELQNPIAAASPLIRRSHVAAVPFARVVPIRLLALLLWATTAWLPAAADESSDEQHAHPPIYPARIYYHPTPMPDRIVLTWSGDPARTVDVTWRTDLSTTRSAVEYLPADQIVGDHRNGRVEASNRIEGEGERFNTDLGACTMHSRQLQELEPDTMYAYRVGDGANWSEWFQFCTAHAEPAPFSFIYFGDAQNAVRSLWSRVIREANQQAPRAAFMLHAGDLINTGSKDGEWGEWFGAGGWLNAMIPSIATPGNHEYSGGEKDRLTRHWRAQFAFPGNGPEGLEESAYWLDYQGVRIVSLNSNERIKEQAEWFDKLCREHPAKGWHIVTFHHPVFSAAVDRDNPKIRDAWKPLFDKHSVDLALQGHDHAYARSGLGGPKNVAEGKNVQQGDTVYVVSVSGPKMYPLTEAWEVDRVASGVQLFQIIHVDGDQLRYEARLATGELYDAFTLTRQDDGPNQLENQIPETTEMRKWELEP